MTLDSSLNLANLIPPMDTQRDPGEDPPPPFMATTLYLLAILNSIGGKTYRGDVAGLARQFGATTRELEQWARIEETVDELAKQITVKVDVNITPVWEIPPDAAQSR